MLSYEELGNLTTDILFRTRIKAICLEYATYIINESVDFPAHVSRMRWAQDVVQQPDIAAMKVQPPTVMDPVIKDKGAAATDPELQAAVQGVVNKMI